jgi:hypothetical protein
MVAKNEKAPKKSQCPVSRAQFKKEAKALNVQINGVPMLAPVHDFSTGSLGWYLNGKILVEVDGVPVPAQIGLSITAVGSKDLPK